MFGLEIKKCINPQLDIFFLSYKNKLFAFDLRFQYSSSLAYKTFFGCLVEQDLRNMLKNCLTLRAGLFFIILEFLVLVSLYYVAKDFLNLFNVTV